MGMTKNSLEYPNANPVTTASQYALMQAIAHGAVPRQDVSISQELAREMIRKTPRRLRSKFAAELAKRGHNPKYTRDQLERLGSQKLDKLAFGFTNDSIISLKLKDIHIYTDDIENPKYAANKFPGGPMLWAKQVNLDTPIDVKLEHGKYWLEDGHHRYYAAYLLGKDNIKARVSIKDNPIEVIMSKKKNNPSAESLTEEWHGRQPREVIDVEEEEQYEPDGAVLAELEELGILLEDREQTISIEFNSDPPMLVANVATENLEVVGGDQKLEFGSGWGSTKNEFTVGHVYLIAYCTDKHHLEGSNGVPESYEHFFGEEFYKSKGYKVDDYKESDDFFDDLLEDGIVDEAIEAGYLPTMVYDTINEKIKLVGGRYTIEDVGLRD